MTDQRRRIRRFALTTSCFLLLSMTAGSASAQSLACTGEAFLVQEVPNAQLLQVDQTVDPFDFGLLSTYVSTEINNLGFDRVNGLLYAIELSASGNNGIFTIDGAYTPTSLGSGNPALPSNLRFDAGDVSADGSTFYVNRSGSGTIYSVPLPSLDPIVSATISGGTGFVFDWAAHPSNGLLYGGDRDGAGGNGQLAVLDPTTGVRTDLSVNGCAVITPTCTASALPGGGSPVAYGGAWFNAAERLFLYENDGQIYEIDLSGTPTIVATQSGPGSSRNDGAACVQDLIGAAKTMSSDNPGDVPANITINYLFENLGTTTLSNLSAVDDLMVSFGTPGVDWTFTSITSGSGTFHNTNYDGDSDTELIAAAQTLAPSTSDTITVVVQLQTAAAADVNDMMCNQVQFEGENPSGSLFGDLSTDDGSSSDPNADGSPDERVPTCITQLPVSLMTFSVD